MEWILKPLINSETLNDGNPFDISPYCMGVYRCGNFTCTGGYTGKCEAGTKFECDTVRRK